MSTMLSTIAARVSSRTMQWCCAPLAEACSRRNARGIVSVQFWQGNISSAKEFQQRTTGFIPAALLLASAAPVALVLAGVQWSVSPCRCQDVTLPPIGGEQESDRRDVRLNIISGNWPQVENWIRKYGTEAALTGSGQTALCFAAEHGALFIARALLEAGADPQSSDNQGLCVLLHAARKGHVPLVKALLDAGADPNGPIDIFGNGPLHCAVGFGHVQVVKLLLEAGCNPNLPTGDVRAPESYGAKTLHEPPLHLACRAKPPHIDVNSRSLVFLLLQFGANPRGQDDRGDTAVHLLVRKGDAGTLWDTLSRFPPEVSSALVRHVENSLGATPAQEAAIIDAPWKVKIVLRCAPMFSMLRHCIGLFDTDFPVEFQVKSASDDTWEAYKARLDKGDKLLPFEDGGDGIRRRPTS
eukprot:TRINITY_DN93377_c0_g1_i1.p1 TRINITY_DN93377_c0_g1~~TRINITY_DN93377_c0_g1_i1.p1  ORF type:complete len:412 (+),score=62.87 TRINITY_DN93377_c0_g1_i1:121-1356(+)